MAKPVRTSPILGAVSSMIGEASGTLVTSGGRFRHSFEIDLAAVAPDPQQPRKSFDEAEIAGLATTMAEQGQLQPILVRRDTTARNRWIIIAGERRWRAAQRNGWPSILAIEHSGDPEVAAMIENLQRVDLTPVEEARGLQRLIGQKNWSQDRAAETLGKVKSEISATLRILTLPSELLDRVLTSELTLSKNVLVELARVEAGAERDRLVKLALAGGLTVRAIRAKQAGEKPERPARSPAAIVVQGVLKVTRLLQEAREVAVPLQESDAEALRALRGEIDATLWQHSYGVRPEK